MSMTLHGLKRGLGNQRVTNAFRGHHFQTNPEVLQGLSSQERNQLADVGLHQMLDGSKSGNNYQAAGVANSESSAVRMTPMERDELAIQGWDALRDQKNDQDRDALLRGAQQDSYQPSVVDDYRYRSDGHKLRQIMKGMR